MKKYFYCILLTFIALNSCTEKQQKEVFLSSKNYPSIPFLVVLGIAQDAGFPQADCKKACCKAVWKNPALRKRVSCLGIVDPITQQVWMLDATPDFREQLQFLQHCGTSTPYTLAGIALTHAHMGHYTGLMHLGREAMGSKEVPVFAMPRLKNYLSTNGPWSQLVELKNIELQAMQADSTFQLNDNISITPFFVPHRDEFSETVGFRIKGEEKSVLFIPDIDKWHLWERDILKEIRQVDYAFLDGTFYENGEIPNRDMSEIPHPFIVESMAHFKELSTKECGKVHFIHINHTNPALQADSPAQKTIRANGFHIAEEGQFFEL